MSEISVSYCAPGYYIDHKTMQLTADLSYFSDLLAEQAKLAQSGSSQLTQQEITAFSDKCDMSQMTSQEYKDLVSFLADKGVIDRPKPLDFDPGERIMIQPGGTGWLEETVQRTGIADGVPHYLTPALLRHEKLFSQQTVQDTVMARFTKIDETNRQRPGESRNDFYCRLLRERQDQLDVLDRAIVEAARNGGNDVKLTDEQKEYFSETYDLKNMSQEEYDTLLADLQRMNILSGEEAQLLRYGTSLRLNGIWEVDASQPDISHQFEDCNGNLLDWARFRASYEYQDWNGTRSKDGTALLFDKLYRVLTQV